MTSFTTFLRLFIDLKGFTTRVACKVHVIKVGCLQERRWCRDREKMSSRWSSNLHKTTSSPCLMGKWEPRKWNSTFLLILSSWHPRAIYCYNEAVIEWVIAMQPQLLTKCNLFSFHTFRITHGYKQYKLTVIGHKCMFLYLTQCYY